MLIDAGKEEGGEGGVEAARRMGGLGEAGEPHTGSVQESVS